MTKIDTIFISGLGAISAAGSNLKEHLNTFSKQISNIKNKPSIFETEIDNPVFEVDLKTKVPALQMRTYTLAEIAIKEALQNAKLTENDLLNKRVGVCLGTTVACQLNDLHFYKELKETENADIRRVDCFLDGNIAEKTSRKYKLFGPATTIVNACSSGVDAIGIGMEWIKAGVCDIVITGGADELSLIPYCGFNSLGILSNEQCRPFDKNRKGLNLGEGAGIVILESANSAKKRRVETQLELAGYACFADSYHPTAPHPEGIGLTKAILDVIKQSQVSTNDISFINAHGTSTHENDKVEGKVLSKIFGKDIDFISTKGYTGHSLGAAGGLEAVFTAIMLKENSLYSGYAFTDIDPKIGIAPNTQKKTIKGNIALSTSLAFGGSNSVIAIRKLEGNL